MHTIQNCKKMAEQNMFKILLLHDAQNVHVLVKLLDKVEWPYLHPPTLRVLTYYMNGPHGNECSTFFM